MKMIANAKPIPAPSFDDDDDLFEFTRLATDVAYNANGAMPIKDVGVTPKRRKKKKAKPDPRGFRWQVRVWLDANKPDQLDLGKWIHELKLKRTFAPILRNALSLYRELMEGQVDMLYQLFPDVKPAPPIITPEKIKEMEKEIGNLRIQVDILIKQQSPNAVDYTVKMAGQGLHKVAPPIAADDDELVIRKDESSGERAAQNFLKSAFALQGKPSPVSKAPVVEADTSSSFLDMF